MQPKSCKPWCLESKRGFQSNGLIQIHAYIPKKSFKPLRNGWEMALKTREMTCVFGFWRRRTSRRVETWPKSTSTHRQIRNGSGKLYPVGIGPVLSEISADKVWKSLEKIRNFNVFASWPYFRWREVKVIMLPVYWWWRIKYSWQPLMGSILKQRKVRI